MAYLSNVVYHRHDVATWMRTSVQACTRNMPESKHPLEQNGTGRRGVWERWANESGCTVEEGLFYDTYIREPHDQEKQTHPVLVVIAFRGTENTRLQWGSDWMDNILSATGIAPRQYVSAIDRLKVTMAALAELKEKRAALGQNLEIYAAGHSLGGGLAQQAAYLYEEITAVFAFNSSPVTNWTQLVLWDEGRHIKNPDPTVFRVEQQGEFLDYVRFVTTRATSRMLGRTDIEFNFGAAGPFKGHSIAALSCHLAIRAAESSEPTAGPLGYTGDEALKLAHPSGVKDLGCDHGALKTICEVTSVTLKACRVFERLEQASQAN